MGTPQAVSAACTTPFADANQDGTINVVDAQCAIITVLWDLGGQLGPPPACTQGNPDIIDVNCDGELSVADAQLHIVAALGQTLSPAIDANGNGCPDACDALACGDGFCDPEYETDESCPEDCGLDAKGSCCLPRETPGCIDADIEATVCAEDPFCCEAEWDAFCVAEAAALAGACLGDCCAANDSPGCSSTPDFGCEECVCAVDSLCCDVIWGESCAALAEGPCTAQCGCQCGDGVCQDFESVGSCPQDCIGEGSCCLPTPSGAEPSPGCGAAATQVAVCEVDSFCCETDWDGFCVSAAKQLGVSCVGECCEGNTSPGCDSSGDSACEACVCGADSFCCTSVWDADCGSCASGGPGFGGICAGVDCTLACGCGDDLCGDGVCDPELGENPLTCPADCAAAGCGDGTCDALAGEDVSNCPADCAGEGTCCLANGTPGCLDTAAQVIVCAEDPFCCTDDWDGLCALLAELTAGTCDGGCCDANDTPGCGTAATQDCEACVCDEDPFCCETQWDAFCAGAASEAPCAGPCGCLAGCGDGVCDPGEDIATCPADCVGDGSCCEANGTPGCEDTATQATVCSIDPFCCADEWDDICAQLADAETAFCSPGDCCVGTSEPGCPTNAACESCVCASDPFCCNNAWDGICAGIASDACSVECGCAVISTCGDGVCSIDETVASCPLDCPGEGSCCEANGSPGCETTSAQATVCGIDPFCCTDEWDALCAELADEVTPVCQPENCCAAKELAGCADQPSCEDCVCGADSFCCVTQWDGLCADAANGACAAPCGCAVVTPFCGDGACGADETVASCPQDCAGEGACCEANETPGCELTAVQAAVCAIDAFCCEEEWDGICAQIADEETDACEAEDCCVNTGAPGCASNPACEACVCAGDPFCCDSLWDNLCAGAANGACVDECGCVGPADCGDGVCAGGETVASCPQDCPGEGACCEANGSPGCQSAGAQTAVCAIDPFCCEDTWDALCAQLADEETAVCEPEDCCESKGTSGCFTNTPCEQCVCANDSFCCNSSWDALCAAAAGDACALACGCDPPDPCGNGVCEPDLGEDLTTCPEDCTCGNGVCDGAETLFDCPADCAPPGCGDDVCDPATEDVTTCPLDCAGTNVCCLASADDSAGCANLALQLQVCAADPFCCEFTWDTECALGTESFGACDGDCCDAALNESTGCGSTGDLDCEACVCGADPFCCDTQWDSACAAAANGACETACDCGELPPPDGCCGSLGGADNFCDDVACTDCVCPADAFCCDTGWDGICANRANDQCEAQCGCGEPPALTCCSEDGLGGPGNFCDDATCTNCVCAFDLFCCDTGWDAACATIARDEFCQFDCGCFDPTDCCAEAGLGGDGSFCPDAACTDCVCAADSFCCDTGWDAFCADCANGGPGLAGACEAVNCEAACGCGAPPTPTGECCETLGGTENFCEDSSCTSCVCAVDPFCCNTGWDGICAGAANGECAPACGCGTTTPPVCGNGVCEPGETPTSCPADCAPVSDSCCETLGGEGAFCGDAACVDCVCPIDTFCCDVGWDSVCGQVASESCATACGCGELPPPTGECCETLGGPGSFCEDASCTACVCAADPFCCNSGWDSICADEANEGCEAQCGCGEAEPEPTCCTESGLGGPGNFCDDATCTNCVCAFDLFCCDTGWDAACATIARDEFCQFDCGCFDPTDCCAEAGLGGDGSFCPDAACTDCVCAADSFCCDSGWDMFCSECANGGPGLGGACEAVDCQAACGCGGE